MTRITLAIETDSETLSLVRELLRMRAQRYLDAVADAEAEEIKRRDKTRVHDTRSEPATKEVRDGWLKSRERILSFWSQLL